MRRMVGWAHGRPPTGVNKEGASSIGHVDSVDTDCMVAWKVNVQFNICMFSWFHLDLTWGIRVLLAFKDRITIDYLESMADKLFKLEVWEIVPIKTEQTNAELFALSQRTAANASKTHRRHRKGPNSTMEVLENVVDGLEHVRNIKPCMRDKYTENWVKNYSPAWEHGVLKTSIQELRCIALIADTDTGIDPRL